MIDAKADNKIIEILREWQKSFNERQKKLMILFVAALVILVGVTIISMSWFQNDNSDRIAEQNTRHVQELASQEVNQIERETTTAVKSIENFAQQYGELTKGYPELTTSQKLKFVMDTAIFDRIGFVNPEGTDETIEGKAYVGDREYFQNGMKGESGWDAVDRYRVTGKPAIIFYAPVEINGKVIGVMVGGYDQSRMNGIFSYETEGYNLSTYLLEEDGSVVANSAEDTTYNQKNILSMLKTKEFTGDVQFDDIQKLIKDDNRKQTSFRFKDENGEVSIGVISQFKESRWMVLSILPMSSISGTINRANRAGWNVIILIMLAFLFVVALMLYGMRRQSRQYNMEMDTAIDTFEKNSRFEEEQRQIIGSLSSLFSSVYFVTKEGKYRRIFEEDEKARIVREQGEWTSEIGKYIRTLVQESYRDRLRDFSGLSSDDGYRAAEGEEIETIEYRREDEEWRRAYRLPVILKGEQNDLEGAAIFAIQEISEEKKKEFEAKRALEDAYDTARLASEAKTTFLSNMSHDIRTPMNAIVGMTAIAAANIDNRAKVSDCLGKITASSKHLLGLINEVLDMSKIETGKVDLQEEEFNMADLIDELISMNRPLIREKNHEIVINVPDITHEYVIGDETRLQQVLTNLLSNAIKYTPEGGRIEIALAEKETNKPTIGWYEITIADNGIGMTEEYQKQLFEPFVRAEDSRVAKIQGTGLGMPIAQNIIRMMNGEITVDSKLNEGTTFKVSFALKLQQEGEADYRDAVTLPVLVVDDDVDACESICTILDSIDIESEWVTTGREAVDKAVQRHEDKNDYYAAIIDWQMPDMDGIETARRIRAKVGEDVPIIIISAYDWFDIEEEARAAGVNAFLSKPVFKSKVVNLFNDLAEMEKSRRRGGEPDAAGVGETGVEEPGSGIFDYDFSGKRMLIVEDNPMNQEIAVEIMGMAGFTTETADNGQIGVDMFAGSQPGYYDVILMDIQMPVLNGNEAARKIRASGHADAETIPILAMTANAFSTDVRAALDAGMNGHVAKPIDVDRTLKALNDLLGGNREFMKVSAARTDGDEPNED